MLEHLDDVKQVPTWAGPCWNTDDVRHKFLHGLAHVGTMASLDHVGSGVTFWFLLIFQGGKPPWTPLYYTLHLPHAPTVIA